MNETERMLIQAIDDERNRPLMYTDAQLDTLLDQMARAVVEEVAKHGRKTFGCECGHLWIHSVLSAREQWTEHIRSLLTPAKLTQFKLTVREGR